MIERRVKKEIESALACQAAVAIIGPRQVGKTTLALEIATARKSIYVDLEDSTDRDKLSDPALYLAHYRDHLVILDEIHRMPEIFRQLRGIIDRGRREGLGTGRFLILGSASIDLLHQSGESLAGRIAYVELGPFNTLEVGDTNAERERLWVRGGYPDSYLAANNEQSLKWRKDFIRTYLERDVATFGLRLPTETLARLWTMLAHSQGGLVNTSRLAASLGIANQTVNRYVDLLSDLLLVRRLQPFHANVKKRLVKSPKIYVRDSGMVHALLGLADYNELAGHPVVGASWEGFVIENLLAAAPGRTLASFYRTVAGAEVDLLLELPGGQRWAIEIKRGSAPTVDKGFHHALEDLQPDKAFIVYGGGERFPRTKNIDAISLSELTSELTVFSQ